MATDVRKFNSMEEYQAWLAAMGGSPTANEDLVGGGVSSSGTSGASGYNWGNIWSNSEDPTTPKPASTTPTPTTPDPPVVVPPPVLPPVIPPDLLSHAQIQGILVRGTGIALPPVSNDASSDTKWVANSPGTTYKDNIWLSKNKVIVRSAGQIGNWTVNGTLQPAVTQFKIVGTTFQQLPWTTTQHWTGAAVHSWVYVAYDEVIGRHFICANGGMNPLNTVIIGYSDDDCASYNFVTFDVSGLNFSGKTIGWIQYMSMMNRTLVIQYMGDNYSFSAWAHIDVENMTHTVFLSFPGYSYSYSSITTRFNIMQGNFLSSFSLPDSPNVTPTLVNTAVIQANGPYSVATNGNNVYVGGWNGDDYLLCDGSTGALLRQLTCVIDNGGTGGWANMVSIMFYDGNLYVVQQYLGDNLYFKSTDLGVTFAAPTTTRPWTGSSSTALTVPSIPTGAYWKYWESGTDKFVKLFDRNGNMLAYAKNNECGEHAGNLISYRASWLDF